MYVKRLQIPDKKEGIIFDGFSAHPAQPNIDGLMQELHMKNWTGFLPGGTDDDIVERLSVGYMKGIQLLSRKIQPFKTCPEQNVTANSYTTG